MPDIEKRKAMVSLQWQRYKHTLPWKTLLDTRQKAIDYFGISTIKDEAGEINERRIDRILVLLMAEILFGSPGRGNSIKVWNDYALEKLAVKYGIAKQHNPTLTYRKFAERFAPNNVEAMVKYLSKAYGAHLKGLKRYQASKGNS